MEFRLTYQGPLSANGSPKEKQEIRRKLRQQLAELWKQSPLSEAREVRLARNDGKLTRTVDGFDFIPLVNKRFCLICALDILFLRREEPGSLVRHGGDIDNRLKTLFDALRMPHAASELPPGDMPTPDEKPFDCLLEDDQLITEVKVTTDRLLQPPAGSNTDVLLVVHVRLKPTRVTGENLLLLG